MKTTNHELYESHGNILDIMDHEHESHEHKDIASKKHEHEREQT